MTISASISHSYSKNLNQDLQSLEGQPINPNRTEGQPINPNIGFDLKLVSAIHRVLNQATEPTMVIPMLLASPAFHLTKVGALRGLLGLTEAWWNRRLGASLISNGLAFFGETTFFSTASRGLTHLLKGPIPWDPASMAHDWVGAGMTLGFLKTAGFVGRRATLAYRGLDETMPQLWTKADQRALFWAGQGSGYLGLVGSHHLEEHYGFREKIPGSNLWLDALGTHIALGLGAHGGRTLLGASFAALEHRLSAQAKILQRKIDFSQWNPGEVQMMAGALGTGGEMEIRGIFNMSGKGEKEGKSSPSSPPETLIPEPMARQGSLVLNKSQLPEASLIPSAPQTAARNKPKFEIFRDEKTAGDKSEGLERLGDEILVVQHFLTGISGLNPLDGYYFTRFVMDRLPDYPSLLRHFTLPPEIHGLEDALSYFCERFSNESSSGLKKLFPEAGILPNGGSLERPLTHEMLVLMRMAKVDAVDYLDRLKKQDQWIDLEFSQLAKRRDPVRIRPEEKYSLTYWQELQTDFPELNETVFRQAYRQMVAERIFTQKIYQHYLRDEFAFAVTDAGHEVFGTAAAFALRHEVNREAFAISPHYRSGTLVGMWAALEGYDGFFVDYARQQLSKATDTWSGGGIQTGSHIDDQGYHILPVHSEVGRNLSIAVGYARALQQRGHRDGVVYAEIGDGSMALSDLHEAMTGAALAGFNTRSLPVVLGIVDNQMAISVEPNSGRALVNLASYAKAFGADFYTCDGNDFLDVYQVYRVAVSKSRALQKPVIIWVQNLPRLNNHSSAAQFQFDFKQHDPLLDFSDALVHERILRDEQVLRRISNTGANGFFGSHRLGEIGTEAKHLLDETWSRVAQEPEPTLESISKNIRLEFPKSQEAPLVGRSTSIIINGAIRAALRDIITANPLTWVNGQDTGMKGGVMQATAGLWELFPRHVTDAPINEPAIMALAVGFALHEGAIAFPEIQFGDYSTSTLHWLIKAGNLLWTSGGNRKINFNARLPVEPGIFGAVYHSTPLEGYFSQIPGITIVVPSTTRDAYGLIRSAAEYLGPVIIFEPKALYRKAIGDAFANEPQDEFTAKRLGNEISIHRAIPDIPKDYRTPLGIAATRRRGKDLTLVTWGLAHYESLKVLDKMVAKGIDVELIDLRTIVPPDMETVLASVDKTGRLLVAHQDRVFASLGREIQGQVHEAFPGRPIVTKVLGMEPVPGIPQSKAMEAAVMVTGDKILAAAQRLMSQGTQPL